MEGVAARASGAQAAVAEKASTDPMYRLPGTTADGLSSVGEGGQATATATLRAAGSAAGEVKAKLQVPFGHLKATEAELITSQQAGQGRRGAQAAGSDLVKALEVPAESISRPRGQGGASTGAAGAPGVTKEGASSLANGLSGRLNAAGVTPSDARFTAANSANPSNGEVDGRLTTAQKGVGFGSKSGTGTAAGQRGGADAGSKSSVPLWSSGAATASVDTQASGAFSSYLGAQSGASFGTGAGSVAGTVHSPQVVRSHVTMAPDGQSGTVHLELQPENLGKVKLHLRMEGGRLVAHFGADSAVTRALLQTGLPGLRNILEGHGLDVKELYVDFHDGQQGFQRQPFGGGDSEPGQGSRQAAGSGLWGDEESLDGVGARHSDDHPVVGSGYPVDRLDVWA